VLFVRACVSLCVRGVFRWLDGRRRRKKKRWKGREGEGETRPHSPNQDAARERERERSAPPPPRPPVSSRCRRPAAVPARRLPPAHVGRPARVLSAWSCARRPSPGAWGGGEEWGKNVSCGRGGLQWRFVSHERALAPKDRTAAGPLLCPRARCPVASHPAERCLAMLARVSGGWSPWRERGRGWGALARRAEMCGRKTGSALALPRRPPPTLCLNEAKKRGGGRATRSSPPAPLAVAPARPSTTLCACGEPPPCPHALPRRALCACSSAPHKKNSRHRRARFASPPFPHVLSSLLPHLHTAPRPRRPALPPWRRL
jgi:hypothetical protein